MKKQLFFILLLIPASLFSMKQIPKKPQKMAITGLQEEKEKQKQKQHVAALLLAGVQQLPQNPNHNQVPKGNRVPKPVYHNFAKISI